MPEDRKVPAIPNPKPRSRSNRKLLGFLFFFFITVLVILFFQSSLSRISEIQIEGNELISADAIGQAAQVAAGDHFFAVSSGAIESRVAKLPIVKAVEVTKHFPGVIHIQVQEHPKVAFQIAADGRKQAVLADGAVVALADGNFPLDKPILTGWSDSDPNKIALCKALGSIPAASLSDISEIKPDPSDSYPDKIKLYTRSQFEVYTTIAYLPAKIDKLPAYIASLGEDHITNGIIKMFEVDNHAPFDPSDSSPKDAAGQDGAKSGSNADSAADSKKDVKKDADKSDAKSVPKNTPKPSPKPTTKDTARPS